MFNLSLKRRGASSVFYLLCFGGLLSSCGGNSERIPLSESPRPASSPSPSKPNEVSSVDSDLPWEDESPAPGEKSQVKVDPNEEWNETRLRWKDLTALVNDRTCFSSALDLQGCQESAQTLLDILFNEPAQMKSSDAPEYRFGTEAFLSFVHFKPSLKDSVVLADLGGWKVLRGSQELVKTESLKISLKAISKMRLRIANYFQKLISNPSLERPDFNRFLEALRPGGPSGVLRVDSANPSLKRAIGMAMNAKIQVKDPHAAYMPLSFYKRLVEDQPEEWGGIGAILGKNSLSTPPHIVAVLPGSPSESAGLQSEDVILAVDGRRTTGVSLDRILKKIRGLAGTDLKLKIRRDTQIEEVRLSRAKLTGNNIISALVNHEGSLKYYFKIQDFSSETCKRLRIRYFEYRAKTSKPSGILLDVRNNPGGSLFEVGCVIGLFAGERVPVVHQYNSKTLAQQETHYASMGEDFEGWRGVSDIPLVVLTNGGSASASEILAGAIQHYASTEPSSPIYHRALVMGSPTYGKGSVQSIYLPDGRDWFGRGAELESRRISYKETVAYYALPSGFFVEGYGIRPDILRYSSPNPSEDEMCRVGQLEESEYALPKVGREWQPPETWRTFVKEVEACMQSLELSAAKDWEVRMKDGRPADYPLISAYDALKCLAKNSL